MDGWLKKDSSRFAGVLARRMTPIAGVRLPNPWTVGMTFQTRTQADKPVHPSRNLDFPARIFTK